MSGTATNASLWANADVYIGAVNALGPINCVQTYSGTWSAVGLLDGDEGFAMTGENETNETYAWGSVLVKRTKSKHKRTVKFVMLEDNATTFSLLNPGSTSTTSSGLTTRSVKAPVGGSAGEFAISFHLQDGYNVKRRTCSRATVAEVGEIKDSESGVTAYEVTVLLYPDSNGVLYTELSGVNGS